MKAVAVAAFAFAAMLAAGSAVHAAEPPPPAMDKGKTAMPVPGSNRPSREELMAQRKAMREKMAAMTPEQRETYYKKMYQEREAQREAQRKSYLDSMAPDKRAEMEKHMAEREKETKERYAQHMAEREKIKSMTAEQRKEFFQKAREDRKKRITSPAAVPGNKKPPSAKKTPTAPK
ncbi:MAG: hypothetical protein WDO70_08220 [Alphaproteobacteria bacterium]